MIDPIHLCDFAQQPDIRIACDQSWTTPAVRFQKAADAATGIKDVYKADDGRFYTFSDSLTTCSECRKKLVP